MVNHIEATLLTIQSRNAVSQVAINAIVNAATQGTEPFIAPETVHIYVADDEQLQIYKQVAESAAYKKNLAAFEDWSI